MRRSLIFLTCAGLFATPTVAQNSGSQLTTYGPPVTLSQALAIVQRGMEQSSAKGHRMAFAVVEPSGELVAFARMDDAPYDSIRLAQQKARTSARLRVSTAELERRVQAGRTVLMSSDEVLAVAGGVLIMKNGRIIGALGASGATAPEDAAIAESALMSP